MNFALYLNARCRLVALVFALLSSLTAHALGSGWIGELPERTVVTNLGDEIYVNGIPTPMIGIAVGQSIKNAATFLYAQWQARGWNTNLERQGDYIIVSAANKTHQKVATLLKTGEEKCEGTLSITDLPRRLSDGTGTDYTVGQHLPKPLNTMVLNEVKVRDAKGQSIMTTMGNFYDIEQNVAFFRERMFELGWREKRFSRPKDKNGVILIFSKADEEANFTVLRQNKQVFVTVNWLSK